MKTRIIRYCTTCMFLLLLLLAAPRLLAQTNTTSLSGTVVDTTGAMIPAPPSISPNAASGKIESTQSKSKGEFSFEQLSPGTYEVKVQLARLLRAG